MNVSEVDAAQPFDYESKRSQELERSGKLKVGIVGFAKCILVQGHEDLAHSRRDYSDEARRLSVTYFSGATMGKQCEVCKDAESKYKCPSCLTPYCSLGCYKKHKETPCAKPDADGSKPEVKVDEEPATAAEDDEPSHQLKRSQLEAVAASEEVRKMLRDRELQELISKIDSSPNSKVELEKAMEGPAFREFTDKLLSIVNTGDDAPAAQL